ncbi:MAG: zf-HC2 domain-containing protein [Acidobacteriaceae bacterium]|nr:zf-HC2 domain-containing protein [Acidobacteriaceae bacterium]
MNHEEAAKLQASSRYLLGDLGEQEMAAFEEHFFNCPECAQDVATGAMFAQDARTVFQEQARETVKEGAFERLRRKLWLDFSVPVAAAACCAALAVVLVQNAGLRHELASLNTPQQPPAVTLKQARGAEGFYVPAESPFWEARFRLANPNLAATYQCSIEREGKVLKTVTLGPPSPGQPFSILLKRSDFPAGTYLFKVRPGNSNTVLAVFTIDLINN